MFGYNNEKIYAHVFLFCFRVDALREAAKKSAARARPPPLLVPGPLKTEMFFCCFL